MVYLRPDHSVLQPKLSKLGQYCGQKLSDSPDQTLHWMGGHLQPATRSEAGAGGEEGARAAALSCGAPLSMPLASTGRQALSR